MRALRDEALEALPGMGNGVRPRDADGVEAMRTRDLRQCALERVGLIQKSRLA